MQPYNQQQHWNANVRSPAQQHPQLAQYPPPPRPPYYYGGDQQQYWNADMLPPAQQQQQLTHHPSPSHHQFARYPPPPGPPYYDGGNQQQYWNSNMLPPAQQQQPLGHYPSPSHQQLAQYPPPPQPPYYYGDGAAGNVGGADEVRTLYIGNLESWMDEGYLNWCFGPSVAVQLVSAKIIRRKQTRHEGYGFLEFTSRAAAEVILQSFNGKQMPYAKRSFKLDWASPIAEYFYICVRNLDVSVTDPVLRETFKSEYSHASGNTPSSAKPQNASHQNPQGASDPTNTSIYVEGLPFDTPDWELRLVFSQFGQVVDVFILHGKCYGFVRFSDRSSAERAVNGRLRNSINIRGKTVRISWARPRGT